MKSALDEIVQVHLKQPDLEFIWVGDDAVDPLQQAQTLNILVTAGIKTREEARAGLGLATEPAVKSIAGIGVGKWKGARFRRRRIRVCLIGTRIAARANCDLWIDRIDSGIDTDTLLEPQIARAAKTLDAVGTIAG